MATLHELFESEFRYGTLNCAMTFSADFGQTVCEAMARVYLAFDEYACFLAYYVTEEFATREKLQILLDQYEDSLSRCRGVNSAMSHPIYEPSWVWSYELVFTGRVILYVDATLDDPTKQALVAAGHARKLRVQIRDRSWEQFVNEDEKPLAFISHDSRDKPFVAELAQKLRSVLCPVWYDEFSLKPGDSLRESIDAGMRDSERCVVVLSPNFLSNPGWGKAEFNAAMNKHITSGGNVVIPIWHGVTRAEVADYSPLVADIVAINTDVGVDEVFQRLHRVLMGHDPR